MIILKKTGHSSQHHKTRGATTTTKKKEILFNQAVTLQKEPDYQYHNEEREGKKSLQHSTKNLHAEAVLPLPTFGVLHISGRIHKHSEE